MRITNQIVSGNSLRNMQKSMQQVNKRTQQPQQEKDFQSFRGSCYSNKGA